MDWNLIWDNLWEMDPATFWTAVGAIAGVLMLLYQIWKDYRFRLRAPIWIWTFGFLIRMAIIGGIFALVAGLRESEIGLFHWVIGGAVSATISGAFVILIVILLISIFDWDNYGITFWIGLTGGIVGVLLWSAGGSIFGTTEGATSGAILFGTICAFLGIIIGGVLYLFQPQN